MNFATSKKLLILSAVAAILCCVAPSTFAERGKLSIAVDGLYSKDITSNNIEELGIWGVHEEVSNGLGGYMLVDYRIFNFLTAGVGFGVVEYSGDAGGRYNSMLDLAGRIILAPNKKVEPYLLGGFGKNILNETLEVSWLGNYHAQAGIGMRYAMGSKMDLDLAAVYDAWSPKDARMDAVGARLGLAFNPGGKKSDVSEKVAEAAPTPAPVVAAPEVAVAEEVIPPAPEEPMVATAPEVAAPPPAEPVEDIYAELEAAPVPVEDKPAVVAAKPVTKPAEKPSVIAKTTDGKPAISYHEVVKGDTLWGIATMPKHYGNGFMWPLIFKANRDQIQDPDLIYPEQVLKVRNDISDAEKQKAIDAASKTPKYVPHTKPRETLPVDYFDW